MSKAIICDKCKKALYADSRSSKYAFASLRIDYGASNSWLELCKDCYRQFCTEFIRDITPEAFDDMYGK